MVVVVVRGIHLVVLVVGRGVVVVVRSVVVVIFIFHILSFGLDGGEGFDGPYKYSCIQIGKKQFIMGIKKVSSRDLFV